MITLTQATNAMPKMQLYQRVKYRINWIFGCKDNISAGYSQDKLDSLDEKTKTFIEAYQQEEKYLESLKARASSLEKEIEAILISNKNDL